MTREQFILDYYIEDKTVILEPFDVFCNAIIGISHDREHLIYSYDKLIEIFVNNDNMSEEEAIDYIEYNIVGLHFSEGQPIIITELTKT